MARGRKRALTLDEQLEKVISEIDEAKERLEELENKKGELEEQIKMNRIAELDDFISSQGLSIEEVKEILQNK